MTEEEKNKVSGIYEELKGILLSIDSNKSWFYDHGFADHANQVIERVPTICPEIQDIKPYKIHLGSRVNEEATINSTTAKAKLNSLVGRIKGLYQLDLPSLNPGNTFIQNQAQSQYQSLSLVLDIQERIISEIGKHEPGTKERTFLEKLKSALPTVKSSLDILAIALKLGDEIGLDPATIHKLLGF